MATDTVFGLGSPEGAVQARSVLDDIMREDARQLLRAALEAEVAEQLARFGNVVDTAGRRAVVRNGHLPERELMTGAGPLPVKQPRVRDRSGQMRFTSKILPPFLRRVLQRPPGPRPAMYFGADGCHARRMRPAKHALAKP